MRAFDIESIRADFPILGRRVYDRPLVYLDNAATAQKPRRVVETMSEMSLNANGNIHRGAHRLADESTALYEAARDTVCEFIGAAGREEVIFTSGATASLNVCAHGLCEMVVGEGDNIIVSEMEHHSNIVPWQIAGGFRGAEIRVLPFTDEGLPRLDLLESLIDSRTRVLAITQCSNVLGTCPDIAQASEIAHRHGVTVVVDGCQGIVHGGADVREMGCDLYVFSGHKLYGPTGIGVLWGKKDILERMPPVLGGGDMVEKVTFERTTYADLPFKFEAGTANYIGAVGMAEAIRYLAEFDPAEIARHERTLLDAATAALNEIEGLRIYGRAAGKAPIVSFTVEGAHAYDLGALLDKQGVAVRIGTHCAQPLLDHYGVGSMCRASFAIYNTLEEVDALVAGVKKAIKMLKR